MEPLQQIIGTDKKNPVFIIFKDKKENLLHVYYGLEKIKKIPDNKNDFQFNSEDSNELTSANPTIEQKTFKEEPCNDVSKIHINWQRIGKTTLSPQIRLYDQDFNFLIAHTFTRRGVQF